VKLYGKYDCKRVDKNVSKKVRPDLVSFAALNIFFTKYDAPNNAGSE
jgi:hypothetical protein